MEDWRKKTLLIIEDNKSCRILLEEFLQESNINILFAKTGWEGITMFLNFPVDIVLLDLKLPDISGINVLHLVKSFDKTPVIIVSACALRDQIEKIKRIGVTDYITKPIDLNKLECILLKYLS